MKHVNAHATLEVVEGETQTIAENSVIEVVNDVVEILESNSPRDKAFIRFRGKDENGKDVVVNFSLNVLGMAGGAAKGVAERLGYKW